MVWLVVYEQGAVFPGLAWDSFTSEAGAQGLYAQLTGHAKILRVSLLGEVSEVASK